MNLAQALTGKRKKYSEILAEQAMSTAPTPSIGAAIARALQGGLAGMYERQDRDADGASFEKFFPAGTSGAPSPESLARGLSADAAPAVAPSETPARIASALAPSPRIYEQNELNPLDVPQGKDRDLMIRTIHAEAGNQSPEGQRAVAAVIRNRAANGGFGGDTVPGVIRAPNQFEPVNTAEGRQRMASLPVGSQQYEHIGKTIDEAYAGNDPTNGATHFFAPRAQAALGRNVPAWGRGPGQDIGDHRFFGGAPNSGQPQQPPGAPQQPPEMAFAGTPAQPQSPIPGQVAQPPGGPARQGVQQPSPAQPSLPQIPPQIREQARQLWMSGERGAAAAILQPYLKPPEPKLMQTPDGTIVSIDPRTNKAVPVYTAATKPKWGKFNEETMIEEGSGRTQSVGAGYRPLNTPEERAAHGIPTEDKRPYQVGPGNKLINPPAETRVTVDQRSESAFDKKAADLTADRFNDHVKGGFEAQSMTADLQALRDIGSRITTGKTAQITAALGPYAEMATVKIDGLDDMQAYQAITSRMAPRMRVPGSGATSDFEMRTFLASLPSLGTTPQGNEIINNTLQAMQEHRLAAADIASRALAKELTPREAEKAIRELPNPLELWKKHHGGAAPSANASRAAPATAAVPQEGATATNKETGQKIIFKGGQWVPAGPQT